MTNGHNPDILSGFRIHLEGDPDVACGLPLGAAVLVTGDVMEVTCLRCLAEHYGIQFTPEYVN